MTQFNFNLPINQLPETKPAGMERVDVILLYYQLRKTFIPATTLLQAKAIVEQNFSSSISSYHPREVGIFLAEAVKHMLQSTDQDGKYDPLAGMPDNPFTVE